uniref:Uncharacterized protein n=1 Tax=Romanomermis culicivorax TaxID=13658 RepID=A0A915HXI8_ROMCU
MSNMSIYIFKGSGVTRRKFCCPESRLGQRRGLWDIERSSNFIKHFSVYLCELKYIGLGIKFNALAIHEFWVFFVCN